VAEIERGKQLLLVAGFSLLVLLHYRTSNEQRETSNQKPETTRLSQQRLRNSS
jgi:hypothetical protein